MQENNAHSDKRWVFKVLIGLHALNIIMLTFFMGLSLRGLIFEPLDEFILFTYILIVLPFSMFFAILIMVFNYLKNKKGAKYENFLFTLLLLLSIVVVVSIHNVCSFHVFQIATVVLFSIGIVFSIRAIRNLVTELRISPLLK